MLAPSGIVATGWDEIHAQSAALGISYDLWQDGIGQLALGLREDGTYAASEGGVVISIARQTGKTFTVSGLSFSQCVIHPGFTVVWTAHRSRTSDETFRNMQAMAAMPRIAPHVKAVRVANGQQVIEFNNGSRILFGAREQGFGRGFAQVDLLVFDEAQILTEKALEDMVPATNASTFPAGALVFMMGTPPRPIDPGEAFTARRQEAISGTADDMVYVEFSADADADPDDPVQWLKANPSYPSRTKEAAIRRMRKMLTNDESFMREALGIWGARDAAAVIDAESWREAGQAEWNLEDGLEDLALGVDVAPDLARASICLAGRRPDGSWHIELDETRAGADWVIPYVKRILEKNPGVVRAVVVDQYSPAAPLMEGFKQARIKVSCPRPNDIGTACARIYDGVMNGYVHHLNQPPLDVAVSAARRRNLGMTGMWAWSRKNTQSDITPIVAATFALWGAQSQDRIVKPERKGSSKPKVRWA